MSDFQQEMNRMVAGFVAQITELARAAARDMIDQALGNRARRVDGRRVARKRGGRRTAADLDRLCDAVHACVVKQPGVRVEQLNEQLGTTTNELVVPIRKLLAHGMLRAKGKRRGTTYFATDKKRA